MALTREDLTPAWVERFGSEMREAGNFLPLTDAQRAESLDRMLAQSPPGEDIWLFGYGSLMWNPLIRYVEQRAGRIYGYHRRFCLWVLFGRGSREKPGLMLGLNRGGSCRGMAFRVEAGTAEEELRLIWMREMVSGAYRPVWSTVHCGGERLRAIVFVVNPAHPMYAGRLSCTHTADLIGQASGWLGSCREYLESTVAHLSRLGLGDTHLSHILWHLQEGKWRAGRTLPRRMQRRRTAPGD